MPIIKSNIERKFSAEGFCNLDVMGAFVEAGRSKTEIRRMFKDRAIKIRDTKVENDKMVWYKRPADKFELVEPGDILIWGKYKTLTIRAKRRFILKSLFYYLRPYVERMVGR